MIKAIETRYKGYRFRSRLEARWAVFFDAMGVKWEYEKEGYDLGEAGWYLPDFWLPDQKFFFEVKGEDPSGEDQRKMRVLASYGHVVYCQSGSVDEDTTGYAWVACPVDFADFEDYPDKPGFVDNGDGIAVPVVGVIDQAYFTLCPVCSSLSLQFRGNSHYFQNPNVLCFAHRESLQGVISPLAAKLKPAYAAARAARFEHGEQP